MRSQSYGDKQRDAQRRKKEEELYKKTHPESAPVSETPVESGKTQDGPDKPNKKDAPRRRSA